MTVNDLLEAELGDNETVSLRVGTLKGILIEKHRLGNLVKELSDTDKTVVCELFSTRLTNGSNGYMTAADFNNQENIKDCDVLVEANELRLLIDNNMHLSKVITRKNESIKKLEDDLRDARLKIKDLRAELDIQRLWVQPLKIKGISTYLANQQ